jgi:hypothetical protein
MNRKMAAAGNHDLVIGTHASNAKKMPGLWKRPGIAALWRSLSIGARSRFDESSPRFGLLLQHDLLKAGAQP